MSAFIEIFSTTDGRTQSMQSGSKPWTRLEVRLENLVMNGACLSSNEEKVMYENRRESRDSAGLVMRGDDRTSERKSSMLIECRRRNVCCVGGGSGVELI